MGDELLESSAKRGRKRKAVSATHQDSTNTIINNKKSEYYSGIILPETVKNSHPQQDFSNPYPQQSRAYIDLIQIPLIKEVFGEDCVHLAVQHVCNGDMNELLKFLLEVHRNKTNVKVRESNSSSSYIKNLCYGLFYRMNSKGIKQSTKTGDKELQTFKDLQELNFKPPSKMKTINNWMKERTKRGLSAPEKYQIPYPSNWKVETWPYIPQPVELYFIDPLIALAEFFIHPRNWAEQWRYKTKFEAFNESDGGVSHFMSGIIAHNMANFRDSMALNEPWSGFKTDDIMFPLTYYVDGVVPTDNHRVKVEVITMTNLTLCPEHQEKPTTKVNLGYISTLVAGVGDSEMIKQIMLAMSISKTAAKDQIKEFRRSIFQIAQKKFKDSIEYCFKVGVPMIIPGHGVKVIRTYLAAINADFPALMDTINLCHGGNCKHLCHLCCFNTNIQSAPRDPSIHKDRDFALLLSQQEIASNNDYSDEQRTNALEFCRKWAAKPSPTTFYGIPTGYPNSPSSIFKVAVRDIFHDLCAGLFPSMVLFVIKIIATFSESKQHGYEDSLIKFDRATSNRRMIKHPPKMHNIAYTCTGYFNGLATLLLGTSKAQADTGATGTTAGLRSGWTPSMADCTLIALGPGKILPNINNYVFKKYIKGSSKNKTIGHHKSITLKNIARICCLALYSLLDFYMEINRTHWSPQLVDDLKKKTLAMQACFQVLYHNMVSLCRDAIDDANMKKNMAALTKLHAPTHYAEKAMEVGPFSQMSCHGREQTHKHTVSEVIGGTSMRECSRFEEMTNLLREYKLRDFDNYVEDMLRSAIATEYRIRGGKATPNQFACDFYSSRSDELPRLRRPNMEFHNVRGYISITMTLINGTPLNKHQYEQLIHPKARLNFFERLQQTGAMKMRNMCVQLTTGVKCKGSEESPFHELNIKCHYNLQQTGPSYSFLSMRHRDILYFGRVVAIITVKKSPKDKISSVIFDLALMTPIFGPREEHWPWDAFKWMTDNDGNVLFCSFDGAQLYDQLWMDYDMDTEVSSNSFGANDRFWWKERNFYERKGIDKYPQRILELDEIGRSPEAAREWIKNNLAQGVPGLEESLNPKDFEMVNPDQDPNVIAKRQKRFRKQEEAQKRKVEKELRKASRKGRGRGGRVRTASTEDIKLWNAMISSDSLRLQNLPALKDICRSLGINVTGNKNILVHNIINELSNISKNQASEGGEDFVYGDHKGSEAEGNKDSEAEDNEDSEAEDNEDSEAEDNEDSETEDNEDSETEDNEDSETEDDEESETEDDEESSHRHGLL